MDFNNRNNIKNMSNKNTKKGKKILGYGVFLILIVFIAYILLKYGTIIESILNPKNIGFSISKNVTLSNQYNLNGRLYFVKNNNMWYITGNTTHKVTNTNNVSDIGISKNGKQVTYVSFHTNYSDLRQMNINGTNNTQLTDWQSQYIQNEAWSATPAYEPNGNYIAYDTNIRKLITGIPRAGLGVWMFKNGTTFPSYSSQIYNETELTIPTRYTGGDADVTWPNNNFLLYTYYIYYTGIAQPDSQIMLYDFNTNQSYPVTPVTSEAMEPRLSPNEKYLAFTERKGNNSNYLYVMKFDLNSILNNTEQSSFSNYKNTLQLISNGINAQPTWSPNGKNIAFIKLNGNSFDIAAKSIQNKKGKLKFGNLTYITTNSEIDSTSKMYWLEK